MIREEHKCVVCGTIFNLEVHHIIYGTGNRMLADHDGLTCYLCHEHHTGNKGVHFNKALDLELKREAQLYYEKDHTREEFLKRYGRLYIPSN